MSRCLLLAIGQLEIHATPTVMRYDFKAVASCNMCGSTRRALLELRLIATQDLNPRRAR